MSHISGFLPIHINGNQTFLVDGEILSAYSARLKKLIKQERSRTTAQIKNSGIEINDFPGGPDGFELVIRFCYNNGRITTNVSNVSLLHCSALFLGMTEKLSPCNLLQQTQNFLEGVFEWSLKDTIICLRSCHSFFNFADSSGLVDKLICALLSKIAQNSDSSSSSSPETASGGLRLLYSCKNTRESIKPSSSSRAWWFDDVAILPPKIIEKLFQSLGAYGADNNSLILTRFLLHYLKLSAQRKSNHIHASPSAMSSKYDEFGGLADTAVHGVILVGKKTFSCRALFWVLRFVSGFGLSKEYRLGLERLIGGMLDEATLDDLLVSGHERGVYDVNLVIRLIKVFAKSDGVSLQKLKKVGRLIDKYLGEISPDQNLKISKFLGVAESLPDSARDSFDGTYRAIDIYLDSHPNLSFEERSRLCRCLNYEKLSLEACKELAKNPKIPPRVAIQALMSQQKNVTPTNQFENYESPRSTSTTPTTTSASDSHSNSNSNSNSQSRTRMVLYKGGVDQEEMRSSAELETIDTILNLQKMQWRVVELEKLCRQMKGQMSRMIKQNHVLTTPTHGSALPRLC